jgi:hypothetical protein
MSPFTDWSLAGRIVLLAVPLMTYLLGVVLDPRSGYSLLSFGCLFLRYAAVTALVFSLYRLVFTRPGDLVPKWMTRST